MPTEHQIQEAKNYILRRVQAEQNILSRLDDYLLQAADKIIDISSRYNISPSLFRFSANKNLQEGVVAADGKVYLDAESVTTVVYELK